MNNKEFIGGLTAQTSLPEATVTKLVGGLEDLLIGHLEENDTVTVSGFGTFEVKKKMERVSVNPTTGKRFLVPPKLTLNYRQSGTLKDKLNAND